MIFFKMTHFSISTFVRKIVQDEEFVPNYERIPKHVWDIFLECHRLAVDKQRQNELKMDDMGIEGLWNEIQEKFPEPQLSDDDYDDEDSDEDDEYYDEDVDDGENKDVDDGEDKDVDDGEDKDVDNGDLDGNGDESSNDNHGKMIVYEKVPNKDPFKLPEGTTVYAYGPNEKNLPLEPLWNYIRLNVPETDDILLRSIPYEAFMEPKPELDELFEAYPSTVWDKELEMDDEILERLVDYLYLIADAKLPAYELELMSCDINDDSKPFPLTELAAKRQRTIQSKQSATETPTKSLSKQPKVEPVKPYSIITRENVFEIISHIIGDITDKKMVPKYLQNRYGRIKRRIAVKRYEEMMEEEKEKTIHPLKKKNNVIWAKPIKVEFDFVPKCTVRWKNPISETIVITKMKRMSTSESRLTRQNPTTSQPEPVSSTNKKYYFTIGHEDDVYDDDETFQPIWIGLESVSATKSILMKPTMQPEILVNREIKTDDKLIHKEEDPESEHPNACNKIEDVVCGICHDIACEEHVAFKPVKVALLSNEDEDDDDVDDEELEFDEEKDDEDQEERIIKRMMPKPCGLDCFLNIKSVRSFDHIMPESDDGDSDDYNENDEVEVPFAGFWPGDEFHLEIQALNEKNNADLFRHGCIEEIVDTEEKVNVNVLPIEFDSAQDIQSTEVTSPFNKSLDSFAVLGDLEYLFKIPETEIGSPPRDIQPMEVSSPSNKLPPTPSRELRALLGTTQNVSPTKTRKYREIEEPNAVESPRKSSRVRSQLESTRNNKTQIEHRSPIKTVESFDICETENSNVSQMKTGSPTKTGSPLKIGSSNADAVSPKKCTKRDLFSDLRVLLNEINNDEPAKNGSLPDTESSATQDSDIVLTKKTGSPIKIEASNIKSPIKSQPIEAVSPPNKIRRIDPTQANGPSMKISLSPSIVQHIKIDPSLPNNVPKIEDQSNENGSQLADFNPSREIVPKSEYSSPPAKRRRIIPLKGFGPVCSRVPKDNRFTVFMGINLDAYFSLNPETGSTFSILNKLHKLINPKLLNSHLKIKQNLELFNSCMSEFVKRWDSKVNQIGRICENDLMHSSNKNSVTLLECNKHFSEEKKRLLNQEARYRIELEYCEPMIYHIRLVLYNLNRKRNINLEVHRLIDMNTNKVLKKFTFNLMPQKRVPDFDLGQYAYNWLAKTVSLKEYSMADLDDSEMDKIKDNDIRLDHWKCEEMDQFLRFYEQLQGNHCSLRSFLRISGVNKSCAEVFKFMNNVMNSCTSSQKEKVTESKDKVDSYSISVSRSDLNSVSGSNLASGSNGKSKIADEDADLDVENEEYDEDIDDEEFDDELDDEEFDEEIDEELGDEEFAEDGDDDDDDDSYDEEYGSNDESKSKSKSKSANKNGTKKSDNKNKYWEYFAEKLKRITSKQTLPDEDRRIQYTPCNHGNGVCDEECPCVKNDSFCEKFCGCSVTCPERFPGCTCDLPCDKHHCPCVKASRECDPDLCKHCGSGEVDPVDVRCSNVSLQRGWKKRLMTGASDVAGWGCFTLEAAKKDELISEYVGEMISHEEANRRGKLYDIRHCSYLFSLNNKFLLDAKRMGNKIRFANHSSEPNCDARVILVGGYHRVGIYAMHKIEAGEELFFNYGYKAEIGLTFVPLKRVVPKRKSFANREIKKKEASDTEIDLE